MGSWSQQHLKIEQLFARFDSLPGFTEEDVQQRIDRLSSLKIDFNVEPLASGEFIMQRTGIQQDQTRSVESLALL